MIDQKLEGFKLSKWCCDSASHVECQNVAEVLSDNTKTHTTKFCSIAVYMYVTWKSWACTVRIGVQWFDWPKTGPLVFGAIVHQKI